jgi:hypothetical protein
MLLEGSCGKLQPFARHARTRRALVNRRPRIVSEALQQNVPAGRRIALLTPCGGASRRAGHALKLFESALFVLRGATAVPWTITGPEAAQVILVHEDDCDERIGTWRAQGKRVVVLSTAQPRSSGRPAGLTYPFRTAEVLALLERLDDELTRRSLPVPAAAARPATPDRWTLVEALFTIRAVENGQAWLVARAARTPVLWIRGDGGAYAADPAAVQVMRDGSLDLHRLALRRSSEPGPDLERRSGMELSWFAGFHASETLAPQLQADAAYRIQRWPGFEQIRPQPVQLRLAAALSSRPVSLDQIVGERMFPRNMAIKTFNALYACGLLVQTPADPPQEPRQGFARLFSSGRRQPGRLAGRV